MRFVIQEMNNRTYYCDGEATREDTLKGASETASSVPNGVQASSAPLAKYSSAYYFAESARMSNLVRASDNVTGFGNQSDTDRHNIMSRLSTVLGERLKYPLWKVNTPPFSRPVSTRWGDFLCKAKACQGKSKKKS